MTVGPRIVEQTEPEFIISVETGGWYRGKPEKIFARGPTLEQANINMTAGITGYVEHLTGRPCKSLVGIET